MPLYIPKIPVCVAIGCSGVALVFQLAAVAGTGWLVSNTDSRHSAKFGLFRYCVDRECDFITNSADWWKACQALSIIAVVTIFISLVLGVLHILREDTQMLTLPVVALGAATAVCVAMEVGALAVRTKELFLYSIDKPSYGYAFYLSIFAGVLSVVTAVLHVVARVMFRY